jgi:hypothetical protein
MAGPDATDNPTWLNLFLLLLSHFIVSASEVCLYVRRCVCSLVNMPSCLPLILCSVPLTLKAETPYLKLSHLGKGNHPVSAVSSPSSVVGGGSPVKDAALEPMYRRFNTYEYRTNLYPDNNVVLGNIRSGIESGRTERTRSTPVPLMYGHETRTQSKDKGKGKKRSSVTGTHNNPAIALSERDAIDVDHVAPFRQRSSLTHSISSFAGPSSSSSDPTQTKNFPLHISERVLFSNNSPMLASPPTSRRILLPSSRSQATGRSILKCIDVLPSLETHLSSGVPIHDRIHIESLKKSSRRAVERGPGVKRTAVSVGSM